MVGSSKTANKSRTGTVKDAAQPFQISLQAGWNLFSMPFSNPDVFTVSQPSSVLSCFGYNAATGAYVPQTFSQAGFTQPAGGPANQYQGYWVFCSAPVQLTLNGDNSAANPLQTNLVSGWNLVGTPVSANAAAAAFQFNSQSLVAAANSSLLGPQAFTYSPETGAYQSLSYQSGAFPAFQAAWVFAFQPGALSTNNAATGTITEFTTGIVATPSASPQAITAGPDGNLWFTEFIGALSTTAGSGVSVVPGSLSAIGRITPTGTVTEFTSGITAGAVPIGIAAGPDGNVWFTEWSGNRIGRITPTGMVTEFTSGITASAGLSGIAAGPDGNLWFTEETNSAIGRITPTGTVTEFTTGIFGFDPQVITAGPDGNMWFTDEDNAIGRIVP